MDNKSLGVGNSIFSPADDFGDLNSQAGFGQNQQASGYVPPNLGLVD
jgi:hypothetical protein